MSEPQRTFGAYTILEGIAEGGMSYVHLAEDATHNLYVALKVLKPEASQLIRRHQALGQTLWEGDIAILFDHPNVIRTYERGVESGRHYVAMELLPSYTLKYMVFADSPLVRERGPAILLQAAEGLAYIHRLGFIHRDVSPKNILLDEEGRPKLIDFSLAIPIQDAGRREDLRSGSVSYMAPEQRDSRSVDERSDIYSFGVTMHEVLRGFLPFESDGSPAPAPPGAPPLAPEIQEVVQRAMHADPAKRFQSMEELRDALADALPPEQREAAAPGRPEGRRFPRVDEECFVAFTIERPTGSRVEFRTLTKNISLLGACCIRLAQPLPRGTRLALQLLLPGDRDPLPLRGEVVWARPSEDDGNHFEIGLRFVGLNRGQQERLRAFIRRRIGGPRA